MSFFRANWKASGRLAIVTGASSGIGRELTKLLVPKQCTVIAVARRADRLEELSNELPGESVQRLIPLVGDVTDQSVCERAIKMIDERAEGKLDLLVNNAGIGGIGPFAGAGPERFREIMEVNVFAPAMWIRHTLPNLRANAQSGPVICNIGSVLGHRAVASKSEYSASKFALHGFTDSLRAELASEGITVTLVSPSTTRSEFFDSLVGTEPDQKSASVGSWSPDRVARETLKAIERRSDERILSLGGKALVYADRLCPPLMNWILRS